MNPEFENIGKLGFGLMRLPKDDNGAIDIEQSSQMVDMFLDAGFTYFDTAWSYDGSEEATRKILVERYPRESYQLATKCAAWVNCKTREEATAQFDVSLERTGAGYFDFYLLHNLGEDRTRAFDDFDMWSWITELKAAGKVRHAGFSFHGTAAELDGLLAAHPEMDFVQLQINYADWEDPAVQSRDCYEVARKHGTPVVIMEPIKGGMLATPSPGRARRAACRRARQLRGQLGRALCREPARRHHRALRHEQRRANARQPVVYEGLCPLERGARGYYRQSAGGAGKGAAHPLYGVRLLREGVPG